MKRFYLLPILMLWMVTGYGQQARMVTIANDGWANNAVNTVIFRRNALVTINGYQYAAYYDSAQYLVLAKRRQGVNTWLKTRTQYQGDAADAHKSISIMGDGAGYLHVAWGQHNNRLNYARSLTPGSLQLSPVLIMTGIKEDKVSYPEFYKLPGGDLLFFYRDGGSGNGNLMLNRYNHKTRKWLPLQNNLIDGQGQRNAYWQIAVDGKGVIYISWVWRESPDVASNHDMAYACSKDGGISWQRSDGSQYNLPINAGSAEYAFRISQGSELINQTAMIADEAGNPYIATYWRDSGDTIPQFHLIYHRQGKWIVQNLGFRKTAFKLSGGGTKRIPVSRPQLISWRNGNTTAIGVIFRDEERGAKVSIAVNDHLAANKWIVKELSAQPVGSWEPSYDTELWRSKGILALFVQNTIQIDFEGRANNKPQPVQVWEWRPDTTALLKPK